MSAEWKELKREELGNVFEMVGKQWMLVTAAKEDGSVNTMTASWGGMGILWNKTVAFVFIRPQRYTKEFIDASGHMSLTFFDEKYRDMLKYMGTVSGRDENKVEKMGLTVAMDGETPYFEEASIVLQCKKLYAQDMKPECFISEEDAKKFYPGEDYHTTYVVEVEKILTR